MKAKIFLLVLLVYFSLNLFAQNPLVGTWEVISLNCIDSDGSKISGDGSVFKEIKIITPTYYFLITQRKQGDSLIFDKAIAGTVQVEGNKYIETPIYFSQEGTDKTKSNFTYKLEGDKFIQSGTITYPDGKVAACEALVFQKVKGNKSNNPAIGTWNNLTSAEVDAKGQKTSHTNATHIRFQTITPTHWMRISYKDNKFEHAMGGTYRMKGNKLYPNFEMLSFPAPKSLKVEINQRLEGNKLYWSGIVNDENGKRTFEDVYEKVNSKTASIK
ncbi:hypothetical protein [Adhaeribacter radiodurans]|uniref:Lipocalin family protein n=1 Tax=Adhaeribacter radiodurans TaxID=2745197 RepID=A0A7L7LAX3_9BACT|nr:hypothetical protein [Adhaeribacter radiodurans]QMU29988.1 hypothetical protein HUW48_19010 [Adhaeribacter radiodurans]